MTHAVTSRGDRFRFAAFVGAVALSFAFAFLRPEAGHRPFLVNLGNGLGFAALALFALQLLVPAPPRVTSAAFRPTLLVRFHGRFGHAALGAAIGHVVLLSVDDPDRLNLLDPVDAPERARAGLVALVSVVVLTLAALRRRHGRQTLAWRRLHVVLGVIAVAFAVGHVAGVGEYLGLDPVSGTTLALVPLGVLMLLYFWAERPPRRV